MWQRRNESVGPVKLIATAALTASLIVLGVVAVREWSSLPIISMIMLGASVAVVATAMWIMVLSVKLWMVVKTGTNAPPSPTTLPETKSQSPRS